MFHQFQLLVYTQKIEGRTLSRYCTHMFITALLTIAQSGSNPNAQIQMNGFTAEII
jgi:hypothetical protein